MPVNLLMEEDPAPETLLSNNSQDNGQPPTPLSHHSTNSHYSCVMNLVVEPRTSVFSSPLKLLYSQDFLVKMNSIHVSAELSYPKCFKLPGKKAITL